jgi:hypothetical protein
MFCRANLWFVLVVRCSLSGLLQSQSLVFFGRALFLQRAFDMWPFFDSPTTVAVTNHRACICRS